MVCRHFSLGLRHTRNSKQVGLFVSFSRKVDTDQVVCDFPQPAILHDLHFRYTRGPYVSVLGLTWPASLLLVYKWWQDVIILLFILFIMSYIHFLRQGPAGPRGPCGDQRTACGNLLFPSCLVDRSQAVRLSWNAFTNGSLCCFF